MLCCLHKGTNLGQLIIPKLHVYWILSPYVIAVDYRAVPCFVVLPSLSSAATLYSQRCIFFFFPGVLLKPQFPSNLTIVQTCPVSFPISASGFCICVLFLPPEQQLHGMDVSFLSSNAEGFKAEPFTLKPNRPGIVVAILECLR